MTHFYSQEDILYHGEILANRVLKNLKHRRKAFKRSQTNAFRLYDWDIPEVRAVVDWYDGHLVVGEYVREQTKDLPWLETVAEILGDVVEVPKDKIYLKKRQTRKGTWERRYERLDRKNFFHIVKENGLSFKVNLADYLDTGLFFDHRVTRQMVRDSAADKRILNLYSYTGSFSVYAASGGASEICTVDLSANYMNWARENFEINGFDQSSYQFVVEEGFTFLDTSAAKGKTWDLIILDPPSFSTKKGSFEFDIQRDHKQLLQKTLKVLAPGGKLYFSTNHQRFTPDFSRLPLPWHEISQKTLPLDYKGKSPHRCYLFTGDKII